MDGFPTVRNAALSLLQSAAAAVARRRGEGASALQHACASLPTTEPTPDDPTRGYAPPIAGPAPVGDCASLGLALLRATIAGDRDEERRLHDRLAFSRCDPFWGETIVDYVRTLGWNGAPPPIPYVRWRSLSDFVVTVPSRVRVALFSDWGTGTATARAVAAMMARHAPDIAIHLGDIYFAGTPAECRTHFLEPLRAALPPATRIVTLCGNHDVYSGGAGYYGLLGELGQPASTTCLRAEDASWQILGADTGRADRDPFDGAAHLTSIDPHEEEWHADKLRGFPGRTVFLSHHQPFSAYAQIGPLETHDPTNPNLMRTAARLQQAGPIDAWFWGHEHRLRLYAPYRGIAAGRNIGYGAIPLAVAPSPETTLAGLVDPPALAEKIVLDTVEGAWANGFALLELGAGPIEASYWQVTRPEAPVLRETLGVRDGPIA